MGVGLDPPLLSLRLADARPPGTHHHTSGRRYGHPKGRRERGMRVFHAVLIGTCALTSGVADAGTYPTSYAVLNLGATVGDVHNRGQVLGVEAARLFVWDQAARTFLGNP